MSCSSFLSTHRVVCVAVLIGLSSSFLWSQESPEPLSIVTYNIRYANPGDGPDFWPNRAGAVSDFLVNHDLIGLQEVTPNQLQDLRNDLDEFGFYGVGRDDGKSKGEHAVIFYRKDRFDVLDRGTFWLSETPSNVGVRGWDAALPRTCTWMLLSDKKTGRKLLIANTHFDHRGVQARKQSGALIATKLAEQAGDVPVILLGDFNCKPNSDPYEAITSGGFKDAKELSATAATGPDSTWSGFKEIAPGRVIDHVFARGSLAILSHQTHDPKTKDGRFASDHLPVSCRVRIGSQQSGN